MLTQTKVASPLSRKAVLLSVTVGQWSARKLDRKITDETNQKYNATKDAGRYNKLLIEAERLKELHSLVSRARHLHYSMTHPWTDEGLRILPNALYTKFTNEFRVIKRDFEKAAEEFCRSYPEYVKERAKALNGLFNPADYPSPEDIRSKFRLEMRVLPFPEASDFRADLDEDTLEDIRREITEASSSAMDDFMQHTARQIVETVSHMAERLKAYQNKKEGDGTRFADSLVGNVREMVDLLPAFNLSDDPKLTAIIDRIKQELCTEEAQELRDNAKTRQAVQTSADQIVAEVEKFLA